MSIFAHLRHNVPTTTVVSSSEFEFEAETFESLVPEGMFREQDFGAVIVVDRAGLAKRGALAGYTTYDAALKAILTIVRSSGLRTVKLTPSEAGLNPSTSTISRAGAGWGNNGSCISGIISTSTTSSGSLPSGGPLVNNFTFSSSSSGAHINSTVVSLASIGSIGNGLANSSNMFFFAGTADAMRIAIARLRLPAWLRHTPGRPDVGRFYSVYPRGPKLAKYVAQDAVFNEV